MILSSEFAALATLQTIVSSKKSFQDIIDDFIEFTIIYHNYKECDSAVIAKDLQRDFNFDVPISVIRNTLRNLSRKQYLTLEKSGYVSSFPEEERLKMSEYISQYEKEVNESDIIYTDLMEYIKQSLGPDEIKDGRVQKVFRSYLLGLNDFSERDSELNKLIGSYIIRKSKESIDFFESIEKIKSSTIIREGLLYQSDLLTEKFIDLSIYLDMEVLFDAYGINGESYKKSFFEFYELVQVLNQKGSKITLKYFDITLKQIEHYFHTALRIYDNRSFLVPETTAMQTILSDISDRTQIITKLEDFKAFIENLNIICQDTYSLELSVRKVKINEISSSTLDDEKDELEYRGGKTLKPLCLVKLLRNNVDREKITEVRHIFATRTRYYLINSKKDAKQQAIPIAVEVDYLINSLWLANSDGLKEIYNVPTNTVTFVQRILSYEKRKDIIKVYEELKQNDNVNIDTIKRQIIALRTFSSLPENMTEDSFNKTIDKEIEEMIHSKESYELQKERTSKLEASVNNLLDNKKLELFRENAKKTIALKKAEKFCKVFKRIYKVFVIIGLFILFLYFANYLRKTWNKEGEWIAWFIETLISFICDFVIVLLCIKIPSIANVVIAFDKRIELIFSKVFCFFKGTKKRKIEQLEEEISELEKTLK